jgi:hypothetical protein
VEKIAAAQAIAELDRFIGIQTQHRGPPSRAFWLPF